MARSLFTQLEQIKRSATYDDALADVNNSAVAEPTVSGSLKNDLNIIRTLVRGLKGTSDWFGDLGKYYDPTSRSGGGNTKDLNLINISGHTLDAKSILIIVSNDNESAGWTVTSGTAGVLVTGVTTPYATDEDETGLPIFNSTGDYYDEGGDDNVCRIAVLDNDNKAMFNSAAGNIVYGKLHDGADNGGSGSGTDVFVSLYTSAGAYTMDVDVTELAFVYLQRKTMADLAEHEWAPIDFTGGPPPHKHSELSASDGTPSPALFVDADGNVIIGTGAPTEKLDIDGNVIVRGDVKGPNRAKLYFYAGV